MNDKILKSLVEESGATVDTFGGARSWEEYCEDCEFKYRRFLNKLSQKFNDGEPLKPIIRHVLSSQPVTVCVPSHEPLTYQVENSTPYLDWQKMFLEKLQALREPEKQTTVTTKPAWRGLIVLIPLPKTMQLIVGTSWCHDSDWNVGKRSEDVGVWMAVAKNGFCIPMNATLPQMHVDKPVVRSCLREMLSAVELFQEKHYPRILESRIVNLEEQNNKLLAETLTKQKLLAAPKKSAPVKCGKKCKGGKKR